jgi:DNA-binding response OmpR family regulator
MALVNRAHGLPSAADGEIMPDVARVLLIDDDPALLDVLCMGFEDAGHEVLCARDGSEGLRRIAQDRPALVVSDVNMPGVDGFSLCRRLRAASNEIPIILLTSRDGEIDEALGLELGADDYVSKPFSTRVLLARVAALLRREQLRASAESSERIQPLRAGETMLDPDRLRVEHRGLEVKLTVTEFRMLEALCGRPGRVLTRAHILEQIRGDDSVVEPRIVDTYVRRLRRKLEAVDPRFAAIETVIGVGYRWRD